MFGKMNSQNHAPIYRISLVARFILFAAAVRILPHPWNFTPAGAMALFGGAKLGSSWKAFLFPLIVLFCGDLFVGFHRDRKRISPPTILETAVRRHLPAVIPSTHAFCSEDFPFGSVSALPSAAPARHPCPGMAIEPYGALPLL